MMLVIALTTWTTSRANLPDIEGTRDITDDKKMKENRCFSTDLICC